MLISLRQLLDDAAERGYGVPAFNINNMEQGLAIMAAAKKTSSPLIIQASRGARSYANDLVLAKLIEGLSELYPDIPLVMHQDHGNSPATCFGAAANGFTSVMMDGSLEADAKTPASYDYNVNVTKDVVDVAHAIGVSVEGELGCLGSLETGKGEAEDGHGFEGELSKDQLLTDPAEAADFVAKTKVDALAIAIGTSHGAYKFTRKPTGEVLAISRIAEIHKAIPNTHLVMHGSSSVPQEWLEMINKYGGAIPETYGVPVEEIQEGIRNGVRKVNIDTDNRLAFTAAVREAAGLCWDEGNRHEARPSGRGVMRVPRSPRDCLRGNCDIGAALAPHSRRRRVYHCRCCQRRCGWAPPATKHRFVESQRPTVH